MWRAGEFATLRSLAAYAPWETPLVHLPIKPLGMDSHHRPLIDPLPVPARLNFRPQR
jgi:hypothetical protein